MTEAKPWVQNKPEQRLSIAVDRFLDRALLEPCYYTALHDADGGGRTDLQRSRDKQRGIKSGQLDWDITQGEPLLHRKLELKRGKNDTSVNQDVTIRKLTECGAAPIVAWTLREAYEGLRDAGFRFAGNVETALQHCEELLAGWDRDAEAIKAGTKRKTSRSRKAEPRYTVTKSVLKRARAAGIRM